MGVLILMEFDGKLANRLIVIPPRFLELLKLWGWQTGKPNDAVLPVGNITMLQHPEDKTKERVRFA